MTEPKRPVRAFVSYSWDDENHKLWVRDFATRLRKDNVDVVLDRWHVVPGQALPEFMERSVRESEYVIVICTPNYKAKSDNRKGGVGYEGDIMTAELYTTANREKFIPVLRRGSWIEAAPSWMLGSYYIDLSMEPYSATAYEDLRQTLLGIRESAPPLGTEISTSVARSNHSATRVVVEVAAMCFVDLMRLLYVASGKVAFRHNVGRYSEFVALADVHRDDLENQLARFATVFSEEMISDITRIERAFKWALERLRHVPSKPAAQPMIFSKMRDVGNELHALAMRFHPRYENEREVVRIEVSRFTSNTWKPMNFENLFSLRLEIQSAVLQKRTDLGLATIADDAVYDLGLIYFSIDHHLLGLRFNT